MSVSEFSMIGRFFSDIGPARKDVILGVGDDCAILNLPKGRELVVSTDTLVQGTHFLSDIPPETLGFKVVAVNLSDIAAMGAEPAWLTLALTIPQADKTWLEAFSQGIREACDYFSVKVVGGDTTRGSLSVGITALGMVQPGKALCRSGAQPGDWLYVTGTLGDSGLGLDLIQGKVSAMEIHHSYFVNRHYRPIPRVVAGQSLRGIATAAIDISDGLASDLKHILKASNCDAVVELAQIPLSRPMSDTVAQEQAWRYALCGGEDYELCFTVPEANRGILETSLAHSGVQYTCIGQLKTGQGEVEYMLHGEKIEMLVSGFDHFAGENDA